VPIDIEANPRTAGVRLHYIDVAICTASASSYAHLHAAAKNGTIAHAKEQFKTQKYESPNFTAQNGEAFLP
jgi:hypothetical protein